MNNFIIHKVMTKDKKEVSVCVQYYNSMDDILKQNIFSHIRNKMNVGQAIKIPDPCYTQITLVDGNNQKRMFETCFILERNYTAKIVVITCNIISFYEVKI